MEKIIVKNKKELEKLIKETIAKKGNKADLNFIDTSKITDMSNLFSESYFNGNISKWNTSNVRNMNEMFYNAPLFNQNIKSWDISKVKDMMRMFNRAESFDQPIGSWDTSSVKNMEGIFWDAFSFNQDISKWKTGKIEEKYFMFLNCPIKEEFKPDFYK